MELESSYQLINKIKQKQCTICIVGLGQVGLPTALSFLKLGYKVVGYDVDEKLIQNLEQGISNLTEKGFEELVMKFVNNGAFRVTSIKDEISNSDVIIVCVPTPLFSTDFKPNISYLKNAIEDISKYIQNEKLIIIESTIPPKTMKGFIIPTIENLSKRKAGRDFLISFCAERIAPGNALQEFANNSRIIGANDDASYLATFSLFKDVTNGKIYRTDTTTAEISKLAENTYRDVNIALANELAIICEQSNVDVLDVIMLANTHPRVNIHKPGPGVGGPCLPKDPYLLIGTSREQGEHSLVKVARSLNDSMPDHVVDVLIKTCNSSAKGRVDQKILVLGVSYKADVNDTRYSPTGGIISALRKKGFVNIAVHDPYSSESFGAKFCPDVYSALLASDCVIIATGHAVYSSLTRNHFKEGCIIMDSVRTLNKGDFVNSNMTYIALGV